MKKVHAPACCQLCAALKPPSLVVGECPRLLHALGPYTMPSHYYHTRLPERGTATMYATKWEGVREGGICYHRRGGEGVLGQERRLLWEGEIGYHRRGGGGEGEERKLLWCFYSGNLCHEDLFPLAILINALGSHSHRTHTYRSREGELTSKG